LEDAPELINESAEGDGWIVKLEVQDENDLKSIGEELLNEEEYAKFAKESSEH
jgi:glycine cleavage system H protein